MTTRSVPIFDGHNDVLLRLYRQDDAAKAFMEGDGKGQLDFPRAKEGNLAGGMFAIFVPSPQRQRAPNEAPPPSDDARAAAGEKVPTPPPPDIERRFAGDAENGVVAVCDRARIRREGAGVP